MSKTEPIYRVSTRAGPSCSSLTLGVRPPGLAHCPQAITLTIRHMGNGVDRIESTALLPICSAFEQRLMPDRHPLIFPIPPHIRDLIAMAIEALGVDVDASVIEGFSRAVDDCIELVVWHVKH